MTTPPARANRTLSAALLALYGALFLACWLGLGPQTLAWSLNRALGVVAYVLLALSVTFGALLGSRASPPWLSRAQQGGWHGLISGAALLLGGLHGLLLTVDAQSPQPLLAVLLPGASTVLPLAVGLGILGLYGLLVVWASTRLRARLSPRIWRALHLGAYPSFALLTAHGLLAGSDGLTVLYGVSLGAVVYTFGLRLLDRRRPAGQPRALAAPLTPPAIPAAATDPTLSPPVSPPRSLP
ncbi:MULTISPECIES: ferric reductase-like transmembrane domain-containing protein [Deinococcus]|uniref:Ferric reductase-like transmembrane domain-containing protein n=1 Tax=Deinococcus rufus TaxID=2136097 RepID=A0ABV7Z9F2_9DEIO|nr:ferric reductase-like transmembrane domain-containing protein [Deinococcus sp. AB2017081]WQE97215.1 ferric reductase-like transmembrane domain-containing protein [Deinococcus sp. AB2017081]